MEERLSAVRAITNMTLFNIGIFLSLLTLHEVGHVFIGMLIGCQSGKAIVFDTTQPGPYAELLCPNIINYNLAYLGSLIFTIIFGSIFLFLKRSPERNLFYVVVGFSILFSSLDIVYFTGILIMQYVFMGLGLIFITFGEFLTGLSYSET